jgi:hypothetical protein
VAATCGPRPGRHGTSPELVPQVTEEGVILLYKIANKYLPVAKRIHFVQGEYRPQNNNREYKAQREIFWAGNNGFIKDIFYAISHNLHNIIQYI